MDELSLDDDAWDWGSASVTRLTFAGRDCVRLDAGPGGPAALARDVDLRDGVVEVDVAMPADRSFHGILWRAKDAENYESFFVRPHQAGNPDSIQYTPVFNGMSSWQLYHGEGFWSAVRFPVDDWFTIRSVFAGRSAEMYVGDLSQPALVVDSLKADAPGGRIGVLVGGEQLHVSGFRYAAEAEVASVEIPSADKVEGVIRTWQISDPFEEALVPPTLPTDLDSIDWTELVAEPSGLADLSRLHRIDGARNTVYARARLDAASARTVALELGFSDRVVVFVNGERIFAANDTYRSRDYRFLGSIGFYDTLYLSLDRGPNDLVVAVSETFGGWGIQGRLSEHL